MNILVIGSGGREHAIVWKLRQSPHVKALYCAPGNAGVAQQARLVSLKPTDIQGLMRFVKENDVDLTVVGPEQPLVDGIVDEFERSGLRIFGPSRAAAMLEGSKVFSKSFMAQNGIPTAKFRSFSSGELNEAEAFALELPVPVVVKADGLAAGKGVLICETHDAAVIAIREMVLNKAFGSAGENVVIEEYLEGEEASIFALTDGERFATLASAQDHKRILDGDRGKNTGGMGAYANAPIVTQELLKRIEIEIIVPTLKGMRDAGTPYRGCLYCGLILTRTGPKVIEYNCRFGDPETQVVVPLIEGDLAEILYSIAEHRLDPSTVQLHAASAVCVVMASRGYPDDYQTGKEIHGLEKMKQEEGVVVFHAGTRSDGEKILSSGGRVLGVTAVGYAHDLRGTIEAAYRAVGSITFDGAYYRSDIGQKALRRLSNPSGQEH
ncbi:MAG: phosphoribosylamine--glycine ligase [Ignavibacteriales bacterium]|nr:phosphoribosylamine--glycine ligase [Ignavibacteriales bacterium]